MFVDDSGKELPDPSIAIGRQSKRRIGTYLLTLKYVFMYFPFRVDIGKCLSVIRGSKWLLKGYSEHKKTPIAKVKDDVLKGNC